MFEIHTDKRGKTLSYHLLVVEDTAEFAEVAELTLGYLPGWRVSIVSSYEEAMERLNPAAGQKVDKIDAVITDLFFPSQTDWRTELMLKLEQEEEYKEDGRSNGMPSENPSGLAVAQWCYEHKVPFVMASQGDRHEGNFKLVREHLLGKAFLGGGWDPLPRVMVKQGSSIDKKDQVTWLRAMIHILQNGVG